VRQILRSRPLGMTPLTAAAVLVVIVVAFVVPPVYGQFLPQRLADYLVFGIAALAVGLIAGHARLLNVGVGATFGVSAYTVAILTHHGVLNPLALLLASLAAGVTVSILFAIYSVVATGLEYLLLTLLTTVAFFSLPVLFSGATGGENGLGADGAVAISFGLDPLQGSGFYWLLSGVTVLWLAVSWYVLSSRAGRVMTAIGRNPTRAAAMGYSVHSYRVAITFYSGVMAGSAGWLYVLEHAFVFPDLLGLPNSLNFVIYSLIGGVESVFGPLLGAAGLRYLGEYTGQQSTQSRLYIALALLLVVYLLPNGMLGSWRRFGALRQAARRALAMRDEPAATRQASAMRLAEGTEAGADSVLDDHMQ
jgi:ABC-type branched-subunit amino acid transport system permease subunit